MSGIIASKESVERVSNPSMLHKQRVNPLKSSSTDIGLTGKSAKPGALHRRKGQRCPKVASHNNHILHILVGKDYCFVESSFFSSERGE